MKEVNSEILNEVGRRDGFTIPFGFFKSFVQRIMSILPYRAEVEDPASVAAKPRTLWQRVRPYTYMAAMFAGVWLMLKMFTLFTAVSTQQSIGENPIVVEAINNDVFYDTYINASVTQNDIIDSYISSGLSIDSMAAYLEHAISNQNAQVVAK